MVGGWSRSEAPTGGKKEQCSADPATFAAYLVPNELVSLFLWIKQRKLRDREREREREREIMLHG
jgi:hypothetical protein